MTRRTSTKRRQKARLRPPPGTWLRFLAAVFALVVLVAGVPAVFVAASNAGLSAPHPLPGIGPIDDITAFFQRDLSATEVGPIVIRVLLIVGWLLWLAMVLSIAAALLEAAGSRLGSLVPQLRMFTGLSRWIAASLTAVSALTPTNLVSAAELSSPRPFTVSTVATESTEVEEAPVPLGHGRVLRGESIEIFAQRTLGDASRWEEIWALNKNQPVGQQGEVWTAAWKLSAGWDLLLPRDAPAQPQPSSPAAHGMRPAIVAPQIASAAQDPPLAEPSVPESGGAAEVVEEYTVVEGDSFWRIAERFLADGAGDGDVWTFTQALINLNAPRLGYDHPAMLKPGDVLGIVASGTDADSTPEAAPGEPSSHVVQSGDSYWEIAERSLGGDASKREVLERTNELIDLNAARLAYDDRRMLHPGDTVYLDASAEVERAPDAEVSAASERSTTPAVDPDVDAVEIGSLTAEGPRGQALPQPTTPPSTAPPPSTEPAAAIAEASAVESGGRSPSRSPIGLGQAALIATGVIALLGARRRARLRAAEPPARVPLPPADMAEIERTLRQVDSSERLLRVDIALRAVAAELADGDRRPVAVRSAPDGTVEVIFDAPVVLGEPWIGDDRCWVLERSVAVEQISERSRAVGAPCIALCQVGVDEQGWDLMVDLEAVGMLSIEADAEAADAVLRGLAVGLATSEFAEVAHLIGVGVDDDAFLGHRQGHVVGSVDEGIELAATLIGPTSTSRRTTFSLRARHTGGEVWEPAAVIVAASCADEVTAAVASSVAGRRGMALVVAGPHPGSPWSLRPDGERWMIDELGIGLQPVGLEPGDVGELTELLGAVADVEAEPEPGPGRGEQFGPVVVPSELFAPGADDRAGNGDGHPDTNGDHPSGHSAASVVPPPTGSASDEPEFVERSWALMARLLGQVDLVDGDGAAAQFERSKTLELLAWLVTHRERATRAAARTALWDLDVRDATFANVVSEARRATARHVTPPEGDEWLRRTLTDELSLHDDVIADADLVRARFDAARTMTSDDAMSTLRPAVDLVRDLPFTGTGYLWPDAEGITSNLVMLATNVTAEYAKLALAAGDAEGVFWATGRGLKVIAGQEALIALRMRAHAEAGDLSGVRVEWESYERVINADPWSDGEAAPKLIALRQELLSR